MLRARVSPTMGLRGYLADTERLYGDFRQLQSLPIIQIAAPIGAEPGRGPAKRR